MDKSRKLLLVLASFALLLLSVASVSASSTPDPRVIPPGSTVQGLSYGDWAGEWWKDVLKIPLAQNPVPGSVNQCLIDMRGQVGLVAFNPVSGIPQDCGTVSSRAMLFVPPVTLECSTVEPYPFFGADAAGLAACVGEFAFSNLSVSLDGVPIEVTGDYVVQSGVYRFSYPADNTLGMPRPGSAWSMARGPGLMFAPLTPGLHTIQFSGTTYMPSDSSFTPFTSSATLYVTVK